LFLFLFLSFNFYVTCALQHFACMSLFSAFLLISLFSLCVCVCVSVCVCVRVFVWPQSELGTSAKSLSDYGNIFVLLQTVEIISSFFFYHLFICFSFSPSLSLPFSLSLSLPLSLSPPLWERTSSPHLRLTSARTRPFLALRRSDLLSRDSQDNAEHTDTHTYRTSRPLRVCIFTHTPESRASE